MSDRELVIVEDSDDDFELFARAYRAIGLSAALRRFDCAEDALSYLQQLDWGTTPTRPSLVLLDLNLPGMDGRELLRLLKADASLGRLPVVIYTTSNSELDVDLCYQQHANAYHIKAMALAELQTDLRQILEYWLGCATQPDLGLRMAPLRLPQPV